MAQPIRQAVNFLLEAVSLAVLMCLVATGFAMEFTMPGRGAPPMTQLGLSRHDMSELHLWLGIAFFALVLIHLALHWRWIWMTAKGQNPETQKARAVVSVIVLALLLAMAALPWIAPLRPVAGGRVMPNQPAMSAPVSP